MRYEYAKKLTDAEIQNIYAEAWASLGEDIQDAVASCGCGGHCPGCCLSRARAEAEAERLARELLGLPA